MDFKKICYNCMRSKEKAEGPCPYCGFDNAMYVTPSNQLLPMTPLNGRYILGRSLGDGGFGITYIALDLHLNVTVAIKELYIRRLCNRGSDGSVIVAPEDQALFDENKKRFLQEARVLALFNEKDNEGVVLVKEHFEEKSKNTAYIVMEYLEGRTLKDLVKDSTLTFDQTIDLMGPVCHALDKIHQFKVIHMDVSPDNIMILKNGKAKLLDFGGVRILGTRDSQDSASNDIIAFKKGYAPPEQYIENGNIGPWTDVYAAAATIYYCLTGKKPVDSMSREPGAELEKPSALGARIPSSSESALMKALSLAPDQRYQSMNDFWNEFDDRKRTHTHAEKNTSGHSRNIIPLILGIAVAVTAFATFTLYSTSQEPEHSESERIRQCSSEGDEWSKGDKRDKRGRRNKRDERGRDSVSTESSDADGDSGTGNNSGAGDSGSHGNDGSLGVTGGTIYGW